MEYIAKFSGKIKNMFFVERETICDSDSIVRDKLVRLYGWSIHSSMWSTKDNESSVSYSRNIHGHI